ncbi:MAG TPA: tRNA (guanosine(46)-N7)-methyltransferase TrmB [Candidatus Binatia bacterium]
MHEFWREIFGNYHPVEIEIGPGTGTFIVPVARQCPYTNFFGLEHSSSRAWHLQNAIAAHGIANARVIHADAACVVATIIPAESVAAYHIYFPDPWWKRRHHHRRLFTPAFAAALARTLRPGGCLHTATDVDEVFQSILQTLASGGAFARDATAPSPRLGPTAFERKGLARGAVIHEAAFVRNGISPAHSSSAAPMTPAESPSRFRRSGVRNSLLKT